MQIYIIDDVISSIEIRFDLRENLDYERIPFPSKGESLLPYTLAKRFSAEPDLRPIRVDTPLYHGSQLVTILCLEEHDFRACTESMEEQILATMLWDLHRNCQSARQYPGGEILSTGIGTECLLFERDIAQGRKVWAARQPSGDLFSLSRPDPFMTGITYFVPSLELELERRRRTVIDQFRADQRVTEEKRHVDEQRRSDPSSF
jgi:hypothetical protein